MTQQKRSSLVKPSVNTPFVIDFDWWKSHDNNWRVYLIGYLCPDHQAAFSDGQTGGDMDWVDEQTAEVTTVDGLLHTLIEHCARQPEFVNENSTLVDSAFRILLARHNEPTTPAQLAEEINRPAETILRTLSAAQIYKGIRPFVK